MQLTQMHIDYWQKNLRLTAILLGIWFVATFVLIWYAIPLSGINFFGWPLSFYMAAQGSLVIYVAIIGYYALAMRKSDIEHGVHEGEED
jgi:putative solute:sodium symporter small subunit